MNPASDSGQVLCEELLYRVATKRKHLTPEGLAEAELFILRPTDEGGLSVFRKRLVSSVDCERQFKKTFGFVTLHAGRVRSLSSTIAREIDIVPDERPSDIVPGHAMITGLPEPNTADAEYVASLLRDQSRPAAREG